LYTLIYFSPTGNAKYLAGLMASQLGISRDQVFPLEFTKAEELRPNKHLIILYPVHGFNAPRTVKRFTRNLPPALFEKVSLLAVGCNTTWINGAVSADLRKIFSNKDYEILVDEILAMPLTFVMNFPEDLNRKLIAESEKKIEELCDSLREGKRSEHRVAIGSRIINFMGKAESPAARMFGLELHANNSCTSCGTCWTNCPEQNIREKKNGKPGFGFSCLMCMRCMYQCPEQAISPRISKFIPIRKGYSLSKYVKNEVI
jgi:Pyruvate/2-oxoacid:ferredoxin oxidoreductase delta subunit/flavodoxin